MENSIIPSPANGSIAMTTCKMLIYSPQNTELMSEAGWAIYIATAVSLAIVTAIQFAERSYRYRRLKEKKHAGTMGFEYDESHT